MKINHNYYLKLAFEKAKINLGKTKMNPSVGCVVVKNNSVISSGYTSINGRPHAEFNALNKKKNFKDSDIFVTLEPCTHYGVTPPCTNIILKKKIKRIYYMFNDVDQRTSKKLKKKMNNKNIKVYKKKINLFSDFYDSYFNLHNKILPTIDAKIAISRDFYSIDKNKKWITNEASRKRGHLLRSQYQAIISTSKTVNLDNSLLNCRIEGFDKLKPDVILLDLKLKLKKNLTLFKDNMNRKIIIITSNSNIDKINFFKKKNIKFIFIDKLKNKSDYVNLFTKLKKIGYNRILIESGLIFLKDLLIKKLVSNLYLFKSFKKLNNDGRNNTSSTMLKNLGKFKKIKVNLNGESILKVKLNNV